MENQPKNKYISVAELAKLLNISRIAIFKRIKKGQILAEKIGRAYFILPEEVDRLVNGAKAQTLTRENKIVIEKAVNKVVDDYGETLKLLGKE